MRYLTRVLTSKLNPNYKYVRQPVDRAPNKPKLPKPLEVRLAVSAGEVGLLSPAEAEISTPKYPPWIRHHINIMSSWL